MRPDRFQILLVAVAIATWSTGSPGKAQSAGPRADFADILGEFSLGLAGRDGDEGTRLPSILVRMRQIVDGWDAQIREYEGTNAAQRERADASQAARLRLALGAVYLDRGRAADAVRELDAATRLDPSRADAPALRALAQRHLGDPSDLEALRAAAGLDPREPVLAYQVARRLAASGDSAGAEAALARFLALEPAALPRDPFPLSSLVSETAGVDPFFPPVLYAPGFALLATGDYAGAIRQFTDALARDPLTASPGADAGAILRAAAALRDGNAQLAIQQLTLATTLEPERSEPHRLLGQAYLIDAQHEAAVQALTAAVRLNPADERARLALARALVDAGRLQAAREALRAALGVLPDSGRARYELGVILQREGQYPEAVAAFEASLRGGPLLGANSIHQSIAVLHRSQQDFEAAGRAFARRVETVPNDAGAHYELGDIRLRQGRHAEARAEFSIALLLDPAYLPAHAATAQVHMRDGRLEEAAASSRRALTLDAGHREARYTLATALIRLGRETEGQREMEVFRRMQIEDAAARGRLFELEGFKREAVVRGAAGDHAAAIALLQKVVDADPSVASACLDLGFALVAAGRQAEAIPFFRQAIELGAHYEVRRHLAAAYAAAGRMDESTVERARFEDLRREDLRHTGRGR